MDAAHVSGNGRFIPACAGNSQKKQAGLRTLCGSSPRVRGTLPRPQRLARPHRFIPACAGNSTRSRRCGKGKPVHPRVCGELFPRIGDIPVGDGSSPRVRGTRTTGSGDAGTWPVHPRVCGELRPASLSTEINAGSSPRVRGTLHAVPCRASPSRFIPACAGNSATSGQATDGLAVHPRVCGELSSRPAMPPTPTGSSPRVRGTRRPTRRTALPSRFIPACAGNSSVPLSRAERRHGSSPRVRGTLALDADHDTHGRFIPACAGNSSPRRRTPRRSSVHPRVCGELGVAHFALLCLGRFIPACAGNSAPGGPWRPVRPVHPRVCGELDTSITDAELNAGSSPRVRGTPLQGQLRQRRRHGSSPRVRGTPAPSRSSRPTSRFIPACAGNSRGALVDTFFDRGSSPRVRGTRDARRGAADDARFIPACAGNSMSAGRQWRGYGGSSPRVRGTRGHPCRAGRVARFIPACAGNSSSTRGRRRSPPVHPRVCGELFLGRLAVRPHLRFIPACAGNSERAADAAWESSVHPRVCGELALADEIARLRDGSSPRVRGTRHDGAARRPVARFIPACAGNSKT